VLPHAEILASATNLAAKLIRQQGRLGVVAPGALADMIVVDGDPLANAAILARPLETILAVMQGGSFVRSSL
jgi:imidazolonepropionase-like amidohydrolase